MVFSKARLAPIKQVSIPRLELMAVLLGTRMVKFVSREMNVIPSRRFIWSDSKCVLKWLVSSKQLPVFVQNRVKEIQRVDRLAFRFVPTSCNPADLPTRGVDLLELRSSQLWWQGPQFLVLEDRYWPEPIAFESDESPSTVVSISVSTIPEQHTGIGNIIDVTKYCSLLKLLRVTAYVKRFTDGCKRVTRPIFNVEQSIVVTRSELHDAEQMWIRYEQTQIFPSGLEAARKTTVSNRLGLIEDDEGIVRCRGRLQYADLPDAAKQPILLQKKSTFSDLVIDLCHKTLLHAGNRQTLAQLRLKYWIPHGMSQVKRVTKRCRVCRRTDTGPYRMPESPPLPTFRVNQSHPFEHTGIDYLGPLYVKRPSCDATPLNMSVDSNAPMVKVWICLFTCAVVRAVHLEIVVDCSAEQFVMCLRRFCAMFGKPSSIISDNAKCFKTTQKLFHQLCIDDNVQSYCSSNGIQWYFIPELAPWMGGFYERLVQSVKKVLRKTLGNKCFSLVELQTLATEASSVINSRPLLPLQSDDTEDVITPSHFLAKHGRAGLPNLDVNGDPNFVISSIGAARADLLRTWLKGQRHMDNFWKCWRNEYLAHLRERPPPDWRSRNSNAVVPTVGSTVLVKDNGPRCKWKVGRVTDLKQSSDGACRSVTVRLPGGTQIRRAVNFLYPLEIKPDTDVNTESSSDSKHTNHSNPSRSNHQRRAALQARHAIQKVYAMDDEN